MNNYTYACQQVLAQADSRFAEIRKRHDTADALKGAAVRKRGNGAGGKNGIRGAPLLEEDGPMLGSNNSRGPEPRTRAIAWACDKHHDGMDWAEIVRMVKIPKPLLKGLVREYEALGGMKEGTIMYSGKLSLRDVRSLAKRIKVAMPRDQDLARWLAMYPTDKYFTLSKSGGAIMDYAQSHDLSKKTLADFGFSRGDLTDIRLLLDMSNPLPADVRKFFIMHADEDEQLHIAARKGVLNAASLLNRLRKELGVAEREHPDDAPSVVEDDLAQPVPAR